MYVTLNKYLNSKNFLKKRGGDGDQSIYEETKFAREQEIDKKNELQALKTDNVATNKAIAVKGKNYIELKKRREI